MQQPAHIRSASEQLQPSLDLSSRLADLWSDLIDSNEKM